MNFNNVQLPLDLVETLDAIYKKARKQNPSLNESIFIERIMREWLEPFKRESGQSPLPKNKVVLKNNLKAAIKFAGKKQTEVAQEIGINRTYLSQIISGKYEPSITFAFLLAEAVKYPPEKVKDLFYLEPVEQE